ncbi:quinone oxidoreductase family protein [Marinoscillum sp.]|uniref:quinone oxidoreductase family protein n=1 Tax=Marinoscillum sp. TaxID=2024838 RepID=UPI003BAAA522
MKAYLFKSPGGIDRLQLSEVSEADIASNEVLIRVRAIGINYAEVLSRKGQYSWAPPRPYIPGMEAAGEVMQVGTEVSGIAIGDRVIMGAQYGAYAECMKSKAHLVYKVPDGWSWQDSAAFLVNFITAWVALFKLGKLSGGERVLIQAAAGGVGTAAVQLASKAGAQVAGTASKPEKLELIKKLGADLAINYTTEDLQEVIQKEWKGVDVCLEVVGGGVFKKSKALMAPFGRLVVAGYASIPLHKWKPWTWWPAWRDAPKVNVMEMAKGSYAMAATHVGYLTEKPEIAQSVYQELLLFVQKHEIKPVVGQTFSFEELPQAHAFMESRKSVGKIVIHMP